jgi:hypothetical protein
MGMHRDDPVKILLAHVDYIESLADCLEKVAAKLRDEGKQSDADTITQNVRDQRFQAMLVRGQLLAW